MGKNFKIFVLDIVSAIPCATKYGNCITRKIVEQAARGTTLHVIAGFRVMKELCEQAYVDLDMEAATFVYDILYEMVHTTPGLGYTDKSDADASIITKFTNGNVPFKVSTLNDVLKEEVRNMEAAYGMIPNPKMNEEQEEYVVYSSPEYCCIPITCQDIPSVSAVIEALVSEAYISVKDDFYEVALQDKYSPDDILRPVREEKFIADLMQTIAEQEH